MEEELKQTNFDMTTEFLRAMAESGVINEQQLSIEKLNELFTPIRERITTRYFTVQYMLIISRKLW